MSKTAAAAALIVDALAIMLNWLTCWKPGEGRKDAVLGRSDGSKVDVS